MNPKTKKSISTAKHKNPQNSLRILSKIFLSIIFMSSLSFAQNTKKVEYLIKDYQDTFMTKKVIVCIYDNNRDKMVYISDKNLAQELYYMPSSLMKPIVLSLALKNNVVKKEDEFFLYNDGIVDQNGYYPQSRFSIGKSVIKDTKEYKKQYFNYEEILLNNSYVGMAQLAQKIDTKDYVQGLKDFGFLSTKKSQKSNEYLPKMDEYIVDGFNEIKSAYSYGKLFFATFDEILKAYIEFNRENPVVISKDIQNEIQKIMIKKSENQLIGAENQKVQMGIYTSTSEILEEGDSSIKYVASTFGFVNYKNQKYTIGIVVIDPFAEDELQIYKHPSYSSTLLFVEVVNELFKK